MDGSKLTNLNNYLYILFMELRVSIYELTAYKAAFVMNMLNLLFAILAYALLGNSIEYQRGLSFYGDATPVGFILTGVALDVISTPVYRAAKNSISPENFDEIHLIPLPIWFQTIKNNIFSCIWGVIQFIIYMIVGAMFNMQLKMNIFTVIILYLLLCVFYSGIGLISSGIVLIIKKGDPVDWFMRILASLLSGELFPVHSLPKWVQPISWVLPQTWIYYLLRLAFFSEISIIHIWKELLILVTGAVVTFLLGLYIQKIGVRKCRKEGVIL